MNNNHFYEFSNMLERVLSFGFQHKLAAPALEKAISFSAYFQRIENGESPIMTDSELLQSMFPELDCDLSDVPTYNQCLWAAESILRIQEETRLTFEAVFLYMPLEELYRLFPLYHEMDFSAIVEEFRSRYGKASVLEVLAKKYKYSLTYIASETGISYALLSSLKSRRRDISKLSVQSAIALADLFRVRVETIAEIKN